MVTAASIVLMVIGTLVVLIGLLFILGGAVISGVGNRPDLGIDLNGFSGAVGGIVAVVGAIFVLFGALELLSGIFGLLGRAWARILAIVVSVLGALVAVLGLIGSRSAGGGSPVVSLLLLVAYVFVIWAMARASAYFAER
jgi:multisubunit Na+/H+ antiporter MnhG subunit